jgi:hypothetical protein
LGKAINWGRWKWCDHTKKQRGREYVERLNEEWKYKETRRRLLVGNLNIAKVSTPYFTKTKGLKYTKLNDTIHIMMELEYMVPTFLHPKSYYAMFHLQTCMEVEVAPLMIIIKLLEHKFFALWHVNDLEFQEYLLYSLICGYFILDPNMYGHIKLEARCIGIYVIHHYCKLVVVYHEYSGQRKTIKLEG